jgi:hypothetical protein
VIASLFELASVGLSGVRIRRRLPTPHRHQPHRPPQPGHGLAERRSRRLGQLLVEAREDGQPPKLFGLLRRYDEAVDLAAVLALGSI